MRAANVIVIVIVIVNALACSNVTFPDGANWPTPSVPAFSRSPRLAITDDGENDLAIVSTSPMPSLLTYAPVGLSPVQNQGPHHLAASPDGKTLYVNLSNFAPGSGSGPSGFTGTGALPGWLLAIDAATYARTGLVQLDRDPGDVVLSRDGKTAFVSHYDLLRLQDQLTKGLPEEQGFSTVAVVDTAAMKETAAIPVCATAHGLALSADEKTLYVACSLADQIAVVDLAARAAVRVPLGNDAGPVGQPNLFPYALARSPSDGAIWISCNGASGISGWAGLRVFDPQKGAIDPSRQLALTGVAMFGDWLPDGKTLVVPHQGDDKISLVDTTSSTEIATISLPDMACLRAHMVRVAAGGAGGWLVCEGDHVARRGSLVTLDLQARTVVGWVEVGLFSDGVVALPPAP